MNHSICLINDSFPPIIDGVSNAVVNYARNIHAHHGNVIVAAPDDPRAEDSQFPFPVVRYPSIDARQRTGYMAGIPFSPHLEQRVQEAHVELIHTHCPITSTFLARQLRQQVDAPVVLTYHTKFDIDIANLIHSRLLQEGSIHALVENISACDAVWVVSRGAGENLRSLGYEGEYTVMPNGVDLARGRASTDAVQAAVEGYDLPENVPVFLFVGRLMWYKGLKLILDALAALKAENFPFRMVFVGSGGDSDAVKAYAEHLQLDDCCFFPGSVSDREVLRAWYTRADLFLFPSTFDTNGLVVREAAACGLASVLVKGSCAAEDVTDGQNAFLIEENAQSLAALLLKIGADRSRMRTAGEHASRELYLSWEDAVANAWQQYEVVLDAYRSGSYPRHDTPRDEFWKLGGELMHLFARAEQHREVLSAHAHSEREHLQKLQSELHTFNEQLLDDYLDKAREILEHPDRYL